MFALFKRHRILKLGGIAIGLFLLWYLISPMMDLIKGMDMSSEDIVGNYAYGVEHYVELFTDKIGKMTSKETIIEFNYTYDKGLLTCTSIDEETNWTMRCVSDNGLYNSYDSTYLFKIDNQ